MDQKKSVFGITLAPLLFLATFVFPIVEVGVLISFAAAGLAIVLFVVSSIAYRRERRSRLLFVMGAFLLFAVKDLFSAAHETVEFLSGNLTPGVFSLEHVALLFDFFILLILFAGLVKK